MQSVGYPILGDKCNAFRGGDFFFFVELNLHNGEYFWSGSSWLSSSSFVFVVD